MFQLSAEANRKATRPQNSCFVFRQHHHSSQDREPILNQSSDKAMFEPAARGSHTVPRPPNAWNICNQSLGQRRSIEALRRASPSSGKTCRLKVNIWAKPQTREKNKAVLVVFVGSPDFTGSDTTDA
jgi:hypothetical protein